MKSVNYNFIWPLIGNESISSFLAKCIAKGQPAQSFIFSGPDNLGKTSIAYYFAKMLLCANNGKGGDLPCGVCQSCVQMDTRKSNVKSLYEDFEQVAIHADFHLVKKLKDKKNVSAEQIRDLIKSLNLSSFHNSYKVAIIKHADTMSESAANSLLKSLEEPRAKAVVIMIANDLDSILPTVRSRSQVLEFKTVRSEVIYDFLVKDYDVSRTKALEFSRLALGRPALAVKFVESDEFREGFERKSEILLDSLRKKTYERMPYVDEIIGGIKESQAQAVQAKRTLEVWQGVLRDLILAKLGQNDRIQNHKHRDHLIQLSERNSLKELAGKLTLMERSFQYLDANISAKNVLENVLVNL